VKQVRPVGGEMPPFVVDPPVGEGGQPTVRVDPNDDEVVEVSPNVPSFVLAKRKRDDGTGVDCLGYCCCSGSSDSSFFACSGGFIFSSYYGCCLDPFGQSCCGSSSHHCCALVEC